MAARLMVLCTSVGLCDFLARGPSPQPSPRRGNGAKSDARKKPRECGAFGVLLTARGLVDVEERTQLLRTARMTQLAQGLGFDLANPLAGDVELLADFFQGVVGVHVDAE